MHLAVGAALAITAICFLPSTSAGLTFTGRKVLSRWLAQTPAFDPESLVASKIFKGINVAPKQYDCMVSLRKPSTNIHYCGGVLIQPDIVLTAAHCMDDGFTEAAGAEDEDVFKAGFSSPNPVVHIGGLRVDVLDGEEEIISSCSTIVHSGWTGRLLGGFDIALVKLERASTKSPCKIYAGDELDDQQKLTALGWGQSESQNFVPTLQKVDSLLHEPLEKCNTEEKWLGYLNPGMLCADGPNGEDTCDGDSGGPLLLESSDGDHVVGITSFGHVAGCGQPGLPGVYTDVSFFSSWIKTEGKGLSRAIDVPFCGIPKPTDASPTDKIVAGITNDNVPAAVSAISRSFNADDLESIEEAVTIASDAGRGETAIKAVVVAAGKDVLSNGTAADLIQGVSAILPAANATIMSGGVITNLAKSIAQDLEEGTINQAASGIKKAMQTGREQDVLYGVEHAVASGHLNHVILSLYAAVVKGVSGPDLAAVVAPVCASQGEECSRKVAGLGT